MKITTHYIDKDALVAEIEKELNTTKKYSTEYVNGKKYALKKILSLIDNIKEKEVDLDKEIYEAEKRFGDIDEMGGYRILIFDDEFRDVLHHFFELGRKSQKG